MTTMKINVGPIHPGTHGALRLLVDLDGETVRNVEPHLGFLHTGVEKLLETRSYMQSPSYMEKLDYVAPLAWDELFVAAVEAATHTEVKPAAQYARTILLELQRIASHLMWLGLMANDLGQASTLSMWCLRDRDMILKLLEDVSGNRMFYVNMRLGGLNRPLPPDFGERAYALTDYIEMSVPKYKDMLEDSSIFMGRTKGVGVLAKEEALNLGVSGPVLRASGVDEDVRKSQPYYAYGQMSFRIPIKTKGDVYSRYRVRYEEVIESIRIVRQGLDSMPKGDATGAPIRLMGRPADPATVIVSRELPRGEGLIYLVPGKQKPYRISLRSPAFSNLAALPALAKGAKFADLFAILGSLDLVMAEVDR